MIYASDLKMAEASLFVYPVSEAFEEFMELPDLTSARLRWRLFHNTYAVEYRADHLYHGSFIVFAYDIDRWVRKVTKTLTWESDRSEHPYSDLGWIPDAKQWKRKFASCCLYALDCKRGRR